MRTVLRAPPVLRRISPSVWMTSEHNIDRLIPWSPKPFQQRAIVRKLSGERGCGQQVHANKNDAGCTAFEARQPDLWHNHCQ